MSVYKEMLTPRLCVSFLRINSQTSNAKHTFSPYIIYGGIKMTENEIGTIIIKTAIDLHKNLGPGLLENVYEVILTRLLSKKGLSVQRQVAVPIHYEGELFDEGFRIDLFINGKVIIELKSAEKISGAHKKQLLTYMRLTNTKLGYILNFGVETMKEGIIRTVNGL
jgi:GxxExxY protein